MGKIIAFITDNFGVFAIAGALALAFQDPHMAGWFLLGAVFGGAIKI
jgi:hypothetical protein